MNKKQEFGAVTEEDFEQTFEQTPEIEISSIKELRESLLNINNKLHADDWQHRVDNLRILRGIIKANRFPTDDFLQNIKFLDLEIKNCVSDLRSQVVREACITVAFLSKEIKNKLDYFLEQIIESLMNLVSNGVKIMSTSGKVALKYIVYNTNSVRILPFFLTTISTSKSTSLRQFCSELLKLICENWNMKYLEKSSSNIAEAIKKGISDADEQTRAQSREAFCWFNGKFPKLGEKLLQSLDPTKQKALQKELLSFKGDEIDSADVFKVPITNAVKTTVKSVTSKPSNFTGRTRVNSAKSENPSANSSTEYLYSKQQSNFGWRAAKPKTATARIDTSDPRGRIQKVSQSQLNRDDNDQIHILATGDWDLASNFIKPGLRFVNSTENVQSFKINSHTSTRDPSPSCKSGYITYSNGASDYKYTNNFQKKASPNTYSSLRYKDAFETQVAEGLKKSRRNSHDHYQSDDNTSETSSVISDQLPSFNEVVVLLNSKTWNDRKRGLNKAEKYITEASLKPLERKALIDIFNSMFLENQTVVIKRFLTVLYAFVDRYHDHLHDWLYSLIIKLLGLQANERVKSSKMEIQKILNLLIDNYGTIVMFMLCCKFVTDKTNEPTIKIRLCLLEYMKCILQLSQPSLLDTNNPDLGPMLGNILVWTAETKSTDLRKISSNIVIKLFDLNASQFSRLLKLLPNTFQDRATSILNAYLSSQQAVRSTETASDVGDCRVTVKPTNSASKFNRSNSFHTKTTKVYNTKKTASNTTYSSHNSNMSSVSFHKRTPKQKIEPEKSSEFIKINTEALQNLSLNCDNFDKTSVLSNSSNKSGTTPGSHWGSYQKGASSNPFYQTKTSQIPTPRQNLNNYSPANNYSYDNTNMQKFLSSQNSHPELSIDNGGSNVSSSLYPSTSNESNVDNKYNPEYYSSGPIDTSVHSNRDAPQNNIGSISKILKPVIGYQTLRKIAELPPEDMMSEILKELSNHNDRHEERKACLFRLIKMFRENTPTDWDEHFKTLLFLLLETMGDNESEIRAQSLRVLQELAKSQAPRFLEYTQLTILKVLEAHKDPEKSVIKAAEECSRVLTSTMPRKVCLKMLIDVISDGTENQLCLPALKMLIKLIKNSNRESIEADVNNLCQALSIVVNHKESQVRKESVLCMVELHKVIGEGIWSLLKLNNSQARLLEVYIKKGGS